MDDSKKSRCQKKLTGHQTSQSGEGQQGMSIGTFWRGSVDSQVEWLMIGWGSSLAASAKLWVITLPRRGNSGIEPSPSSTTPKARWREDLWTLLLWFTGRWAELSSFGQGDEERIVDVLVVGFLSSLQHLKHTPQETETSTGNRINASEMAVLQTPDAPMIRFTLHHGHLLDATMGASSIDLKTRIIGLNKPRRSLRASSKWLQVQGSTVQPVLYWRKCGYARVAGTFRWEPTRMQEPS